MNKFIFLLTKELMQAQYSNTLILFISECEVILGSKSLKTLEQLKSNLENFKKNSLLNSHIELNFKIRETEYGFFEGTLSFEQH